MSTGEQVLELETARETTAEGGEVVGLAVPEHHVVASSAAVEAARAMTLSMDTRW
jgi:hypothetical protein